MSPGTEVLMFTALALTLSTTDALAAEAPSNPWGEVVADAPERQIALERFELGRRRVRTGVALLPAGAVIGTVGFGAAAIGLIGGYFGGDPVLCTGLVVGGGVGVVAGGAMMIASPFYLASGLAHERRALAALGTSAPRWAEYTALGTGLTTPVLPLVGIGGAVAFSLVQHDLNQKALRSVQVTPTMRADGGGVAVSGRF